MPKVYISASPHANGGIWRFNYFFTRNVHEVELTDEQIEKAEKDIFLKVHDGADGDVIPQGETLKARRGFRDFPSPVKSVLRTTGPYDENDPAAEASGLVKQDIEEEETERTSDAVERRMQQQERRKAKLQESQEDGEVEPTEAAAAKATELGVDIAEVTGTGKDGRVLVSDVEAFHRRSQDPLA